MRKTRAKTWQGTSFLRLCENSIKDLFGRKSDFQEIAKKDPLEDCPTTKSRSYCHFKLRAWNQQTHNLASTACSLSRCLCIPAQLQTQSMNPGHVQVTCNISRNSIKTCGSYLSLKLGSQRTFKLAFREAARRSASLWQLSVRQPRMHMVKNKQNMHPHNDTGCQL